MLGKKVGSAQQFIHLPSNHRTTPPSSLEPSRFICHPFFFHVSLLCFFLFSPLTLPSLFGSISCYFLCSSDSGLVCACKVGEAVGAMLNSSALHDGRGSFQVVSRSELGTTGESMFIRPQNDTRPFLPLPIFLIPRTDLAFRAFALGECGSDIFASVLHTVLVQLIRRSDTKPLLPAKSC